MRISKLESILLALIVASATMLFLLHVALGPSAQKAEAERADDADDGAQMLVPFDAPSIDAEAAFVYDVKERKVIFSQNATTSLPLASLTKLMTMLVASERMSATSTVTIDSSDLAQYGDNGLRLGERWNLKNLVDFTMTVSSNDGAHAIARSYDGSVDDFVSLMNQRAAELGLSSMHFSNPTGLDLTANAAGAYGSAEDVAKLFSYLIAHHPDLLEATTYQTLKVASLDGFVHTAHNTDTIIDSIPGLIASKTGYTDLAGGNLAVEFDVGIEHPVVVAVLGSTYENRFSDVERLVDAALSYVGQ